MNKAIIAGVIVLLFLGVFTLFSSNSTDNTMNNNIDNKDNTQKQNSTDPEIIPVEHASLILNWGGAVIYADPVGKAELFAGKPDADVILVTDIHGDHFDPAALKLVTKEKTVIVAPKAVADLIKEKAPELTAKVAVMDNGETKDQSGFELEAIPMYNIPESEKAYHTKGRGNGYVIERDGTRIYISGDTSGTPEMKALKDIDIAFVAMNLPYTMGVEEAAEAVLAFKPAKVYPYHYRTPDGFSDVAKFKQLVDAKDSGTEVVQLEWYPK